jgi:dihydrodipicolinate synthase/N-acetylneuraminate lyase
LTENPLLAGRWGFALTPFTDDGVDLDAFETGVRFQAAGGVDAIVVAGAIGQGALLRDEEREACLEAAVEAAEGETAVLLALVADAEAPRRARHAAEAGAGGLVLLPDAPGNEPLRRTASTVAAACALPIVLYHRPPLRLEPAELTRLCEEVPALAAVKDGHRDVRLYRRLRDAVGDRLRWATAWEDVALPFWTLGVDVFCPFTTAYAPDYSARWTDALARADVDGARSLLAGHAHPMVDLRLSRPGIDVAVVHEAMRLCGLPGGRVRPPASELDDRERRRVHELVRELEAVLDRLPLVEA